MKSLFAKLNWSPLQAVVFALLLAFFAFLLLHQIELPVADDMARHLVNGKEILSGNFDVLYKNVYSYTMPEAPFVNHHWLSGVIFHILFLVIGWKGLVVFKVLVFLLTFFLLFRTAIKRADFWLVSLLSIPTIIILAERGNLRPEIFSYLFIAIFLYILFDWEKNPDNKKIWWLLPLQLLWVNMHLFFIIGPALVGGLLVEKIVLNYRNFLQNPLVKKLSLLFVSLGAVTLINPNGLTGALYPLNIFQDYGFDVQENNSLLYFFETYPLWGSISRVLFVLSVALIGLSFIWTISKKKKPIFLLLGSLAAAGGGFVIARLFSSFSFFFLLAGSANLNDLWVKAIKYFESPSIFRKRVLTGFGIAFFVLLFTVVAPRFLVEKKSGIGLATRAEDAGKFLKENDIKGPFFNDYDSGSYLTYNLYPEEKVFADNRPEAYSGEFWKNTYEPLVQDEKFWQENIEKFDFNTIFFYRYDEGSGVADFLFRRFEDSMWALVYADDYAVIYLRNNELNQETIKKWRITPENITERMVYLLESEDYSGMIAAADNFNLVGRTDLAREAFWRVVTRWPESGKVWKVMADWQLTDNTLESSLLSIMYLNKALSSGYTTPETYTLLAAVYIRVGYLEEARKMLDKALAIDSKYEEALGVLDILNSRSGEQ